MSEKPEKPDFYIVKFAYNGLHVYQISLFNGEEWEFPKHLNYPIAYTSFERTSIILPF